jgi:outer membrane protein OmpA-like peptidoglycan-associated protein
MGDLRLAAKIRALDPADASGIGLSLLNTVYLPTGDQGSYNSDGSVRWEPRLVLDYHGAQDLTITLNVGYLLRPKRVARNLVSDDLVRWGIGAQIPMPVEELHMIASLWGAVPMEPNVDPDDVNKTVRDMLSVPIEFAIGAKIQLPDDFQVHFGAGAGVTQGVGAPQFRAFATVLWAQHSRDRDGDGLDDDVDKCPDDPEDIDTFEDDDGCPDPDNDRDGIPDASDKCPLAPEDVDTFQDQDGCPDPDNDEDLILDTDDNCPLEAEDIDQYLDGDGCPDPDNDGDGVLDVNDKCPLRAEDPDGFKDEDGCPDPDNDMDGIEDAIDECPDQPETKNGFEDDDGCPDTKIKGIKITRTQIELGGVIYYATGKADIKKQSLGLLDKAVQVLAENPQITKLLIEGHTDSRGPDAYNLKLSKKRAASVREYLIGRGIPALRLQSEGYGETKPLCQQNTGKCRAKNRRTAFTIIEVNGAPVKGPIYKEKREEIE